MKRIFIFLFLFILPTLVVANCNFKLFNIASNKGISINEYINEIANECDYTIIVKDDYAQDILKKPLNQTNLKNLIISEVLDIILSEQNLAYELKDNVLKIAYLMTKTYDFDYIISKRSGTSSTNVTLSSSTQNGSANGTPIPYSSVGQKSEQAQSGLQINSIDTFTLWSTISQEIQHILNRPEDNYEAHMPVLNKEAGMITITATQKQIARLDNYIKDLQAKLRTQVLIDVHLYSVTLNNSKATGIDWSQLFSLQNYTVTQDRIAAQNVNALNQGAITTFSNAAGTTNASATQIRASMTINEIIKYLKEQGDVRSISNPKIVTLNNQAALISVGNQFFYKLTQSTSQNSVGGNTVTQNDIVDSVFAGILLDITPEISKDEKITLKINPSISEIIGQTPSSSTTRTLPPDLSRKQLSSVVTASNGEQIILGGLIGTTQTNQTNKIPLLGDVPIIGNLFRSQRLVNTTTELVVVIRPFIISDDKAPSLQTLGYEKILNDQLNSDTSKNRPDKKRANER